MIGTKEKVATLLPRTKVRVVIVIILFIAKQGICQNVTHPFINTDSLILSISGVNKIKLIDSLERFNRGNRIIKPHWEYKFNYLIKEKKNKKHQITLIYREWAHNDKFNLSVLEKKGPHNILDYKVSTNLSKIYFKDSVLLEYPFTGPKEVLSYAMYHFLKSKYTQKCW